jgi:hypothetical protein
MAKQRSRVGRAAIAELEQQVEIGRGEFASAVLASYCTRSGNPGPHSTP